MEHFSIRYFPQSFDLQIQRTIDGYHLEIKIQSSINNYAMHFILNSTRNKNSKKLLPRSRLRETPLSDCVSHRVGRRGGEGISIEARPLYVSCAYVFIDAYGGTRSPLSWH